MAKNLARPLPLMEVTNLPSGVMSLNRFNRLVLKIKVGSTG
jgi:hypothetical protein